MVDCYETERLLLRVLGEPDSRAVCDFYWRNKEYFEPFEPERLPGFYTPEFHRQSLAAERFQYEQRRYLRLYLFLKEKPELVIGSVCFDNIRFGSFQSCTLGYKMDKDFQRQGYMLEALIYSLKNIIFKEYGLHRVEALAVPENTASLHLLERLGFEKEGVSRDFARLCGVWRDHVRYALINYDAAPCSNG